MAVSQELLDAAIVAGVFGGLGIAIWSKMKQSQHPLYIKLEEWRREKKEKIMNLGKSGPREIWDGSDHKIM